MDVAQNSQNYFPVSSFRIAMAITEAPTLKLRAISPLGMATVYGIV
jgi:hypothetical protein